MNNLIFMVIIITLTICTLVLFFLKKKIIYLFIVISILLLTGILGFKYFTSSNFRIQYNMIFNQCKSHIVLNSINKSLPLPPQTVFVYRFSETGVTYFTRKNSSEIMNYYQSILKGKGGLAYTTNSESYEINYITDTYIVQVKQSDFPLGNYIIIDLKTQ